MRDINTYKRFFCCIKLSISISILSIVVTLTTACDIAPKNVEYKVKDESTSAPPKEQLESQTLPSSNTACTDPDCSKTDCASASTNGPETLDEECEKQR